MTDIGLYKQTSEFTTEKAGTSEWCSAQKGGKEYFIKKLQKPVYPSEVLHLSPEKFQTRLHFFHSEELRYRRLYDALRAGNSSEAMIVPEEIIVYQYHICVISEYFHGNIKPEQVCLLSEWQRLVLMRTLTLALMDVHKSGIVHADMKPNNILFYQDPQSGACRLRLIDFDGSYFNSNPPQKADDIGGDPAYWAPEIYAKYTHEHIPLTEKIDDFALGIIFHYLWCGTLPQKPNDQTIGQYIYNGNKPQLDAAKFPEVISKLIQGLLTADPEKRLSCRQAYEVLGAQLPLYPQTIKKIVPDEKIIHDEGTAPPSSVPVRILYVNVKNSEVLLQEEYTGKASERKRIYAKKIKGYRLVGPSSGEVTFDKTGKPNLPGITFKYKKIALPLRVIAWFAAIVLAYFAVAGIGLEISLESKNWESAAAFSSMIPGFQNNFPEDNLKIAIGLYRSKRYESASMQLSKSENMSGRYYQYRTLCRIHQNGAAANDYNFLLDNLGFEDASELFISSPGFVKDYMVGSWTVNGDANNIMTVRKNEDASYTIYDLIEDPGDGTWSIANGDLLFQEENKEQRIKLLDITIDNKNQMRLKSYLTNREYTLTRQ